MASKKSKNIGLVLTLMAVSIVGGVVLGAYVVTTPSAEHIPSALRKHDSSTAPVKPVAAQNADRLVPILKNGVLSDFQHEKVTIPRGQDARVFLVNEYLRQLHDKGLGNKDARAIGCDLRDGIAYMDFNQAFEESYGTMDEATVLNGIEATLGQFPDISQVQFEVDGKPMETSGNVDLTQPQKVIPPGQPLPSASDGA